MSKRVFDEISDEEWEQHDFNPSRVFGTSSSNRKPPPPIESFAFQPHSREFSNHEVINLDDDEDDDGGKVTASVVRAPQGSRSRRLVVEDDSDYSDGADKLVVTAEVKEMAKKVQDDDDDADFDFSFSDDDDWEGVKGRAEKEETDLVGKALQKCAKISVSLRQELYGSSSAQELGRYAETEISAARIVTQEDITKACISEDSCFEPLLKPYQIVGVNFLMLLHRKNIGGAILADEMGLGKTVQAVTYLSLLKYLDNDPGPHMIVCPASVLENWERELKRWSSSFSVVMFHGVGRTAYSKELNSLGKAGLPPPFNVLLTSYTLFERRSGQAKDDRKVLKRWKWSCVILDEAHVLKDKSSFRWKNLMSVAKDACQRLMLTGTPLQNDLHELWSLLEFMMPDIFATGNADSKILFNADAKGLINRIKSILGPFILRRLKSDVMQQLVCKIQKVEYLSMEKDQANAYKETIDEYRAASQAHMDKSSKINSNNYIVLPKSQISNYFVQFRKVANHPLLVRRIYRDEHVILIALFT